MRAVSYERTDECPNCLHCIGDHTLDGCLDGWSYDSDGIAVEEGCPCNLTLAR